MATVKKTAKTTKPQVKDNDGAKKGGPSARQPHPSIKDDTKLTEIPGDFDYAKHAPIKRKNWAKDELFFRYKASEMRWKAEAFDKQAEEAAKLGSGKERAKARRLIKLQEKMKELTEQLEAQGIDVEGILADEDDD